MPVSTYQIKLRKRWNANPKVKYWRKITSRPQFVRAYLLISIIVIAISTCVWSFLGAKLQLQNADQLINADLFADGKVLHGAQFPGQHSFLIKWPLFYLIKLLGYSSASFIAVTMLASIATIALLLFIIYRIEKRPMIFATICLALSSVLILVPTVPYSGALLPVNMAMLTTRNLEYIAYVFGIIWIVRSTRILSRSFACAVLIFAILFASDKLFLLLGVGGAVIAIIWFGLFKKWAYVSAAIQWLLASVFATILASAIISIIVIAISTCVWSFLGAKLQLQNADQLINADLFADGKVLHGAQFPGQHSFLIKWPLFYLIKLLGYSSASFIAVTMLASIATIALLLFIIYRIEKRPMIFATICLALSSVLILVPTVPYSGALLPVNMAMLTTRNLEYIAYVFGIIWIVRSTRILSRSFACAVLIFAILFASDKLFLLLGVGGAVIAIIWFGLFKKWAYVSAAIQWLLASVFATILASAIISIINLSGFTNISNQSTVGPYGAADSAKQVVLGTTYAVSGLLTNFGANPAYSAVELRQISNTFVRNSFSPAGFGYLVNLTVLLSGAFACYRIARESVNARKQPSRLDVRRATSAFLILSTIAAAGVFIISNHYYAVDARYEGIALFAVAISGASYVCRKKWMPEQVALVGAILIVSSVLGVIASTEQYSSNASALAPIAQRNLEIAQALTSHKVEVLVGDYWRVVPTKLESRGAIAILPLQNCTLNREILTSSAWQVDLRHKRFAYLLSSDASLTDFPRCSLKQVIDKYGRPNASYLIAGTLAKPKEQLLFYDKGTESAPKLGTPSSTSTVLPINLDQLPNTLCSVPTVMNIVAHQDDDLLFLSPDVIHDIDAKHCVRTIYITAGDAGNGQAYWLGREQGSEAAYSSMLGTHDLWIQRIVALSDHQYITVANPKGNPRISLIFMHLPDGNLRGQGFRPTGNESLQRLEQGQVERLHSVDDQSVYTSKELMQGLSDLMSIYRPTEIHTQSSIYGHVYPDHSDHMAAGNFALQAYNSYETSLYDNKVVIPIKFYSGYPIHELYANISGNELQRKEAAFLAYAAFDGSVCHSHEQCLGTSTYGSYINRQYENPR